MDGFTASITNFRCRTSHCFKCVKSTSPSFQHHVIGGEDCNSASKTAISHTTRGHFYFSSTSLFLFYCLMLPQLPAIGPKVRPNPPKKSSQPANGPNRSSVWSGPRPPLLARTQLRRKSGPNKVVVKVPLKWNFIPVRTFLKLLLQPYLSLTHGTWSVRTHQIISPYGR